MSKLVQLLLFTLFICAYSNDTIDFIRCFYRNFVPNVKLIFDIVDAIAAQDWIKLIGYLSSLYGKIKDIITLCKA